MVMGARTARSLVALLSLALITFAVAHDFETHVEPPHHAAEASAEAPTTPHIEAICALTMAGVGLLRHLGRVSGARPVPPINNHLQRIAVATSRRDSSPLR